MSVSVRLVKILYRCAKMFVILLEKDMGDVVKGK